MIALDSSALLAIVLNEPEAVAFGEFVLLHDCVLAAPTVFESHLALKRFRSDQLHRTLDFLLASRTISVLPFDTDHMQLARDALDTFGKIVKHPARLNFGDCMAYAVAKKLDIPLLFKGDDFTKTDIKPALPS